MLFGRLSSSSSRLALAIFRSVKNEEKAKITHCLTQASRGTPLLFLSHEKSMVNCSLALSQSLKNKLCNRCLRIKVCGNGLNQLVTYNFLVRLLGLRMADKVVDKGLDSYMDKCTVRLRRGYQITLYQK